MGSQKEALMMTLRMEMVIRPELKLELTGGWTTSIFPLVEEWLNKPCSKHQRALPYIGSRASMNRYRSVVDYIVGQVFPKHRQDIFKFYGGWTPDIMMDLITNEERKLMEISILAHLEVAHQLWVQKERASWKTVRDVVVALTEAA